MGVLHIRFGDSRCHSSSLKDERLLYISRLYFPPSTMYSSREWILGAKKLLMDSILQLGGKLCHSEVFLVVLVPIHGY